MIRPLNHPTIEEDGWTLVSAEERHATHPGTFPIPSRAGRESLTPGTGVKLLFHIETKENGKVVDRGIDRMWVITKVNFEGGYIGVLDNDPGSAENLTLREGDMVFFMPEHVSDIEKPPRSYIIEKFGESFFEE